ncbi:uncharacterized protein LOC122806078 [Protopterus annectens]|uniref:uncharacterized protein LOC122806078 n=1 Tax=Protopterus annectens TaxID=7888 RepID=UPI001CFA78C6|nr:uncharacterized protein LOC122806078 [Protopterus annectens]
MNRERDELLNDNIYQCTVHETLPTPAYDCSQGLQFQGGSGQDVSAKLTVSKAVFNKFLIVERAHKEWRTKKHIQDAISNKVPGLVGIQVNGTEGTQEEFNKYCLTVKNDGIVYNKNIRNYRQYGDTYRFQLNRVRCLDKMEYTCICGKSNYGWVKRIVYHLKTEDPKQQCLPPKLRNSPCKKVVGKSGSIKDSKPVSLALQNLRSDVSEIMQQKSTFSEYVTETTVMETPEDNRPTENETVTKSVSGMVTMTSPSTEAPNSSPYKCDTVAPAEIEEHVPSSMVGSSQQPHSGRKESSRFTTSPPVIGRGQTKSFFLRTSAVIFSNVNSRSPHYYYPTKTNHHSSFNIQHPKTDITHANRSPQTDIVKLMTNAYTLSPNFQTHTHANSNTVSNREQSYNHKVDHFEGNKYSNKELLLIMFSCIMVLSFALYLLYRCKKGSTMQTRCLENNQRTETINTTVMMPLVLQKMH